MQEQRTRTSSSVGPSSSFAVRKPRPQSITSIASLRQPSWKPGTHSRRQSVESETQSVPSSPMTYFPPPSSFSQSIPLSMSARRASTANLSTSLQASLSSPYDSSDEEGARLGGRTPRLADRGLEASLDSPRSQSRRRQTLQGPSTVESRKASDATLKVSRRPSKSFSTPVQGYGATHANPPPSISALGLGHPEQQPPSRRSRRDDALSSPRRISTSQAPRTAHPHRSPASLLGAPSHEAYYAQSQPATSTTPRFKDIPLPDPSHRLHKPSGSSQYPSSFFLAPSPRLNTAVPPRSLSSALNSPARSSGQLQSRLGQTASVIGLSVGRSESYDGEGEEEDEEAEDDTGEGLRDNGKRVWYSSFVTIDWMHDALKESSRIRKLRKKAKRSFRGSIINSWDRFQGWLVVTIIGVVTAIIAYMIVRAEMAFFDLKEGFCTTSWGTPKRFCCSPRHQAPSGPGDEVCGDWMEWGQFLAPREKNGRDGAWIWGGPEFVAYLVVALSLAVLASVMTIYLSSSDHHTTSKDSAFITPSTTDLNAKVAHPESPSNNEREPLLESSVSTIQEEDDHKRLSTEQHKVMYYAAGSGIPEIKTILSGFVIHGYLGGWTLFTKAVGLALSVASGLSLGKEGPLVHIASCVGNIVSRLFTKYEHNEAKRREVLSAACAAGVSVAFGAPIGGVLFSLEEVSYYFPPRVMWRSFWCAAVAAITLRWLNPFGNQSLVLFEVTYTKDYQYWEFGVFILLGIFGGLYGAIFSRLNFLWSKHVRQGTRLGKHPILEVIAVTLFTTVLGFLNPYCRMGGTELIAGLFAECVEGNFDPLCVKKPQGVGKVLWPVFQALVIKGVLTIVTFGIKLPAGIFIPSLVVGACFGRIIGLILEYTEFWHPELVVFGACKETGCVVPGLYAMVGAAATLAGVTRTTVSLAVIMVELTGSLNYVVPVMLSILVAKTVADGLERKGIYDVVIDLNQFPYLDSKHEYMLGGHQAFEAADPEVPVLRADKSHTVRSLTGKLLELVRLGMSDSGFPILIKEVVDADGRTFSGFRVIGFLGINELEHTLSMLADEPDANINLKPDDTLTHAQTSVLSIFSFAESLTESRYNPYDLSKYIDRAPITVQTHSPLELVQQLFVRLGARQILVTDPRGVFRGLITKKAWLAYLVDLEKGQ